MIKHSNVEFFGTFGYEAPKSDNDKKATKVSAKEKAALAKIDKKIELIKLYMMKTAMTEPFVKQDEQKAKEPEPEQKSYRKWIG